MPGERETRSIRVVDDIRDEDWELHWIVPPYEEDFVLGLVAPDGREWTGQGWNMFEAFTDLRRQLDPLEIKLCCQGARTKVGTSGMTADMGRGMAVYRIEHGRVANRRDLVGIFDPAPVDEIGTVEEQAAYRERWMRDPTQFWRPRNLLSYLRYGSPLEGPLTRLSNWWWFFRARHRRPSE